MPFEKNKSGNPAGRPKGKSNHFTGDVKAWLLELFGKHTGTLEADLKAMKPRERWEIISRILPFITPKASDVRIDINNLTDAQINEIIKQITQNLQDNE